MTENAEIVEKAVKCVKCVAAVFEKNLAFELFECHFERKFDWQCLIMNQQVQKIVKGKTETAHFATTVFQQKLGFQVLGFFSRLIYNKIEKIKWLIFEKDSFYVNDSQSNCGSRRNFNAFFRVLKIAVILEATFFPWMLQKNLDLRKWSETFFAVRWWQKCFLLLEVHPWGPREIHNTKLDSKRVTNISPSIFLHYAIASQNDALPFLYKNAGSLNTSATEEI